MSLSAQEQQALDAIEDGLAGTAPELVRLLATFTRLASGEEMPARERIRPAGRLAAQRIGQGTRRVLVRRLGRQQAFLLVWLVVAIALITVALVLNRSAIRRGSCTTSWPVVCAGQAFAGRDGLVTPPGLSTGVRCHHPLVTEKDLLS